MSNNREAILLVRDADEKKAAMVFENDSASGSTFTSDQVLDSVPRLWEEWLDRDEDSDFKPGRREEVR